MENITKVVNLVGGETDEFRIQALTAQGYGEVRCESGVTREEARRRAGCTTNQRTQSQTVVQPLVLICLFLDQEGRTIANSSLYSRRFRWQDVSE